MNSLSRSALFIKYSHIFFSLLLLVLSTALVSTAVGIRDAFVPYSDFLYNYSIVLTSCILFACTFGMIISLLGCYAAFVNNRKFMIIYIILLLLVFLLKFVVMILYVSSIKNHLSQSVEQYYDVQVKNYELSPEPVDYLQSTLECCGKTEYSFFEWVDAIGYIPSSCCPQRFPETNSTMCRLPVDIFTINNAGCLTKLQKMPELSMSVVSWLLTLLLINEIISFTLSTYMWLFIMKRQNTTKVENTEICTTSEKELNMNSSESFPKLTNV